MFRHVLTRRRPWRKALWPLLLLAAGVTIVGMYLPERSADYRRLLGLPYGSLGGLLALSGVEVVLLGVVNVRLYRRFAIPLGINEGIGLAAVNALANHLPLSAGMVPKGIYLNRRYGLSFTRFVGTTMAFFVISISGSGLLGLATVTVGHVTGALPFHGVVAVCFLLMTLVIAPLWVPLASLPLPRIVQDRLAHLDSGWALARQKESLVAELVGLRIAMTILLGIRFWIAFRMLSQDAPLLQCFVFASSSVLAMVITVVPGGLGIREGIVAGFAAAFGFSAAASALAVATDRLVSTVVVLGAGIVYSYILGRSAGVGASVAATDGGQ